MLVCGDKLRKTVPANYLLLFILTLGESCFVAAIAADLEPGSVLTAMGALVITTGALYAATTCTSVNERLLRNLIFAVIFGAILNLVLCIGILIYG